MTDKHLTGAAPQDAEATSPWTYSEVAVCCCGHLACVIGSDDGSRLFCFAHSRDSAATFILPPERPAWWPKEAEPPAALLDALMRSLNGPGSVPDGEKP